ncbi:MAG: oxidoreductase [Clostridiales bacterium]|nr:oxidoreductase [Clostridiales bacterium]
MIYKPFKDGIKLSRLGMGNMRLPTQDGMGPIDREKAQEIIDYAIAKGINYFDTAYVYHNGESEKFLGEALKKYPRDSYYLATKYFLLSNPDVKAVFEEQLSRLQTDYIDFYLLHAVGMNPPERYLDKQYGTMDYLLERKKTGQIRYLGFSFHGNPDQLEQSLNAFDWDFVQIQLNYLDWTLQDAKRLYDMLAERKIPVIVMEPVRGGRLASLSPEIDAMLKAAEPNRSVASWAFRWLMRLDNVHVILSGMSTMEQIIDNVNTFENDEPLSDDLNDVLMNAGKMLLKQLHVPCTSCRYCCEECPQGLDIPGLLGIYNEYALTLSPMSLMGLGRMDAGKKPEDCVECGNCMKHCPQAISIPEVMKKLAEAAAKSRR